MTSLLTVLSTARRSLVPAPCPSCGSQGGKVLVRFDRYFLPIDVTQCRSCGLVHTANHLSPSGTRRFYTEHYPYLMGMGRKSQLALAEEEGRRHAKQRVDHILGKIGDIGPVLDIGCGDGYFLAECSRLGIGDVAGIEPGIARRRIAAGAGIGTAVLLDRMIEDLENLPFPPRIVTLFHVLEHLSDPGAVLRRLSTLTDGWVVIEVPDLLGDWSSLGLLFFHVGHRCYFSQTTLSALMIRSGLTPLIIEREGQEGGIYPANLRIFARPSRLLTKGREPVVDSGQDAQSQIRSFLKPWSLKNGYPRAALRLARLAIECR